MRGVFANLCVGDMVMTGRGRGTTGFDGWQDVVKGSGGSQMGGRVRGQGRVGKAR